MNEGEAQLVLADYIERFRKMSYAELLELNKKDGPWFSATGPSGATYEIQLNVFWDDRIRGNLRITVDINDASRDASFMRPMTSDFIIAPDGSFVGE